MAPLIDKFAFDVRLIYALYEVEYVQVGVAPVRVIKDLFSVGVEPVGPCNPVGPVGPWIPWIPWGPYKPRSTWIQWITI